jgi:hypothetical protein
MLLVFAFIPSARWEFAGNVNWRAAKNGSKLKRKGEQSEQAVGNQRMSNRRKVSLGIKQ